MKNIVKFSLTLLIVTAISALLLSFVYTRVRVKIDIQKKAKIENAISFVFDGLKKHSKPLDADGVTYWKCFDQDNKLSGYAVLCKKQGFSSVIKIIVGVKPDGTITKISIIEQQETPGLGAKMMQIRSNKYIWDFITGKKRPAGEKTPYFPKQFFGKNYRNLKIVKNKPNKDNEIEALTGATISSKAVLNGIKESITKVLKKEKEASNE